jgi:serine/threonine-protein kinase
MRADFRLGDWTVRPRRECIERGGNIVHVHSKPMAVLECLAAAGGEVVTRDELFEAVWPGLVVTDDALTQCVVELRKAFGDSARDAQIIRTVPRVGFCLIPPVSGVDEARPAAGGKWKLLVIGVLAAIVIIFALYKLVLTGEEPATTAATEKEQTSIAVLPFVNMSSDPEQEYFSDGISEELLNLLAKIPELRVISHTSAFTFKGKDIDVPTIARQLGVTHILEGSVRKAGNEIRITAQLVEARSDTHLWSQTYDRDFREVFAIQDEIARHVVDEVEVTLLGGYPRSAPADPEAFRLYLLGKYHRDKYEFPEAMQYFQQAIALDPQYAQAHLALAEMYGGNTFFGYMSPRQGYAKIKDEIARVLEIDDKLAEVQSLIAEMNFYFDWEWESAEEAFQRAISLIPSEANTHKLYAWFNMAMGRVEKAQGAIRRGLELEPLAPDMYLTASNVFYMAGLHEQAIARCQEALELSPNHSLALSQIGWSYLQMGLLDEAISVMERSVNSSPALVQNLWMLGHAYAVAGKSTEAREVLRELHDRAEEQYVPPFGFALVHVGLGEKDEAMDWLEKAYEDRNGWMVSLNVNALLDPLRDEARFQGLLERMNFPD